MRKQLPCPICKQTTLADSAAYPFCCERCRMIDLGNWLGGRYAVPGRPDEESERDSPRPEDPIKPPGDDS